jgi:hypothetical protein
MLWKRRKRKGIGKGREKGIGRARGVRWGGYVGVRTVDLMDAESDPIKS